MGKANQNTGKTHCKYGHEFTKENTYVFNGCGRACIVCRTARSKEYRASDKGKIASAAYQRKWTKKSKKRLRLWGILRNERVKLEVLSHYGKAKKLQCCWEGCSVCDIDMLSLDHVNNDWREVQGKRLLGVAMYMWIKRNCYPSGFQTLCFNHQFKKEVIKKRKDREAQS